MLNIIVPARGGSKGIPKKNIKPLNGKELLKYTLETAEIIKELMDDDCRIILSSDSHEVLGKAKEFEHVECFLRDSNLADDKTLTVDVIISLIKFRKN